MITWPKTWLLAALLVAAPLAGCGGGSKSTSQTTTTSQAPAATAPSAGTSTTPSPATGVTGAALEQAVAQCKAAVQAQKVLPADSKAKLEAVCPAAARGESAPVKRVAEEVCANVIKGSAIPAGPAREQALAACRRVK
jgi:ABC-type phosphate transport system substrate-binding protein